jgi:hypothetical protein
MKRLTAAVVVALWLAFLPHPRLVEADAQDATDNLAQFAQIAGVLRGFTARGEIWRGQLTPGESTLIPESLMAGNEYLLLATGDFAVVDLDLELFDPDLEPIDADLGDDNTPVVSVTPVRNGTYYIRVTLVTATAPAAWYALQVMYR